MEQKFYAIKNKHDNIRLNSSSGGVFYELAKYILNQKGVVYGAAYDENQNINHIRVDNINDIKKLSGSKYSQSDMNKNNCLKNIVNDLKNGLYVLFSGTPCQVNIVKNITKDCNTNKLLLVDIICHGVPDVIYYQEYLKYMEKQYNSKIKKINMRYKNQRKYEKNKNKKHIALTPVEPHIIKIEFINGKKYVCTSEFDIFYQFFDLFIKKGCFNCPFAQSSRISDITIGDFHEFSSKLNDFNDGNGVSLMIINSTIGDNFFSKINQNFDYIIKEKKECLQPALSNPANKPTNYDEFQQDFKKNGFDYAIKKHSNNSIKYKIKKMLYKLNIYSTIQLLKYKIKRR